MNPNDILEMMKGIDLSNIETPSTEELIKGAKTSWNLSEDIRLCFVGAMTKYIVDAMAKYRLCDDDDGDKITYLRELKLLLEIRTLLTDDLYD